MAKGTYTVPFARQSFTNANGDYDFVELTPGDDKPLELVAVFIGVKTEVGDAQAEMLDYSIVSDNTSTGNGTSTTPRPTDSADQAATFTAETVASTPASSGTAVVLHNDTFNVQTGLQLVFPPEMRPTVRQGDTMLCVRLDTALADDATISGTVYVKEI